MTNLFSSACFSEIFCSCNSRCRRVGQVASLRAHADRAYLFLALLLVPLGLRSLDVLFLLQQRLVDALLAEDVAVGAAQRVQAARGATSNNRKYTTNVPRVTLRSLRRRRTGEHNEQTHHVMGLVTTCKHKQHASIGFNESVPSRSLIVPYSLFSRAFSLCEKKADADRFFVCLGITYVYKKCLTKKKTGQLCYNSVRQKRDKNNTHLVFK